MTSRTARTTTRVRISENASSAVLNAGAHAAEHCAVDRESLDLLDSDVGRQLLVRRAADRVALCTVAARTERAAREVQLGTAALARLAAPAGGTGGPRPAGELDADFVAGDDGDAIRLTESLRGEPAATTIAILAPHGGWIERGTDDQAEIVYELLAARGAEARAWIARGYNPQAGAHTCWHITSSEISERSFPKLGVLFGDAAERGRFAHAVAFHGHDDDDTIVVGGGRPNDREHTELKKSLRRRIDRALDAIGAPAPVVVRRSGPLSGAQPRNIVNRITAAGNGIQLEQPLAVRADDRKLSTIARAVADFYAELAA